MAVLTGFLISGFVLLLNSKETGIPITIQSAPTPVPIKVYISGNIEHPGVYELPVGSRLEDLIKLAKIDFHSYSDFNLSSKLYDGQHIHISSNSQEEISLIGDNNGNEKININEASLEKLITLPGIGEAKTKKNIQ